VGCGMRKDEQTCGQSRGGIGTAKKEDRRGFGAHTGGGNGGLGVLVEDRRAENWEEGAGGDWGVGRRDR